MNEKLNLVAILKDCPKGTKLYSPIFGEVEFNCIFKDISGGGAIECENECGVWYFNIDGTITIGDVKSQIILLYPSKDKQDWSKFKVKSNKPKFDPQTLKPFEKILGRDEDNQKWNCGFFSHKNEFNNAYPYRCVGTPYTYCIPYNEDTMYLVGTDDEAPEFYRYWEE